MMHRFARILSLATLSTLILGFGCQKEAAQETSESGALTGDPTMVVAEVGDQKILLEDVNRITQIWQTTNFPGSSEMSERELQVKALDNLIQQDLLLQASREANLLPTEDQVENVIANLSGRYPSPEDWKKSLELQGMDETEFRANVFNDMAIRQYLSRTLPETLQVVTPEDARAYYDSNPEIFSGGDRLRARHILLRTGEVAAETAQARIDSLYALIQDGADFEQVAKDHSDCPSASRGGDLGEFGRGDMVPPFEEAAYALEPGQISKPIETQFGYHIIRLEEKVTATTAPFDDQLQGRVIQQLQMERYNEAVQQRVEELRGATAVTRNL